ncbi:hypothetical protein [Mycolicibacterium confluentis]|uniref:Uncharacterized protein n=1 Tax=Mycolicibacterium confluentis TaxID=28047 RepID=A0A7I7Y568_9MYCO|nr:hypothetical protein [Mycolicibacterium confluentis]MCV7319211.1 hypothetical protein [Mycolicibacterium confluentis]BBZ36825.1 hypothetical protein MCNF_54300 [Mycolicibacterium confluentis]
MTSSTSPAESFAIRGSHLIIYLYFDDSKNDDTQLRAVCDRFLQMDSIHPVATTVVISDSMPRLTFEEDLTEPIEFGPALSTHQKPPSNRKLLRASFHSDVIGKVVVGIGRTYADLPTNIANPVTVVMNSSEIDQASVFPDDPDIQRRAATCGTFVATTFRQLCESFSPLYAVITVESPFPTPRDLIDMSFVEPIGDLFFSHRVLDVDPSLEQALREAYSEGYVAEWDTGTYYSAWAPLNPLKRTVQPNPMKSSPVAREVLSSAMSALFPSLSR